MTIVVGRVGVPIISSSISGMSSESNFAFFYWFGLSSNSSGETSTIVRVKFTNVEIVLPTHIGRQVVSDICRLYCINSWNFNR